MDYDDNDFQSQSFQLTGEENVKFSPGLHSYSLPKFDLDENLQVHLRYDSLVDSEVLLGIQTHEENQWIEDFSRGSSGIEFSSSAPESCSISRHHNVWSEATSTESVEMLLKSVGQDDMIIEKTIIEESDACDEQVILKNQMEPNLNQDDSAPSQVGDTMDVASSLPPDKCVESPSVVSTDFTYELHQVENTPTDCGGKSQGEGSGDTRLNAVGEKCSLEVTESNLCVNEVFNKNKKEEESPLINASEENKSQDGSTVASTQVDPSSIVMQSFAVNSVDMSNQHAMQLVDSLQNEADEKVGQHLVLTKEAQIFCHADGGNRTESSEDHLEKPSDSMQKDDSMGKMAELSSEAVFSENLVRTSEWKDVVLSTDTEMCSQFMGNAKEALHVAAEHHYSSEVHSADVSASSAGSLSNSVQKLHPFEQQKIQGQDNFDTSERQGDLPERDSDQLVVDSLSNTESSIHITCQPCATENVKDDGDLGVHESEFGAEVCISSSMHVESVQRSDQNLAGIGLSDIRSSHPGVSVLRKENAKSSTDTVSTMVVSEVTKLSSLNTLADVHHIVPASNISEDEVVDSEEKVNSPVPVHSTHLACKEETVTTIPTETSLLVHTVNSQMADDPVTVSETERSAGCDKAGEMHSEIMIVGQNESHAQQCPDKLGDRPPIQDSSMVENDSTELFDKDKGASIEITGMMPGGETSALPVMHSLKEPSCNIGKKDEEDNKNSEDSNDGQNLHPGAESNPSNDFENSSRPATLAETDAEFHASEVENYNLNSNVTNCGSPTVISCNQASQSEIEHQEEGRGSLDRTVSLSDELGGVAKKAGSPPRDPKENIAPEDDRTFTFKVISLADLSGRETDNGWRPFSSMQPYASNQNAETSATISGSCQRDPTMIQEISFANPQTSGVGDIHRGVKNSVDDKLKPPSEEPAKNETAKKEIPLKDETTKSDGIQGPICENAQVTNTINMEGNKVEAAACNPEENNAVEADRSFTFEVHSLASLSNKGTGDVGNPATMKPYESPQAVAPPTTAGLRQIDAKVVREIPRESPRTSGVKNVRRSFKNSAEDKAKPSSKVTDKEISKEGKNHKETSSPKQTKVRGSNLYVVTPSSLGDVNQVGQSEGMRTVGYFESSSGKSSPFPTVAMSNLPDLNTSASPSALFQQPFTDCQQVQLRAQIFVYGSLIQGTSPDEACMVSAFGESNGGRSSWEPIWRVAVERVQNQKSPFSNHETPILMHSDARISEQAPRQSIHQNDPLLTPSRAGSKGTPSNMHSAMPFSSPLWTISTQCNESHSSSITRGTPADSHKSLLPFHPYHSPHLKHYAGNTPWHPQTPSSGTWVLTPQQTTSVDLSAHYPTLSVSEAVHVASVRESSVAHPSVMQHVPPSPFIPAGVPTSVPALTSLPMEAKRMAASASKQAASASKRTSADLKTRKRKKTPVSEDSAHTSPQVQTQINSVSAGPHLPTSVSITAPVSALRVISGSIVSTSSPLPSTHYQIVGGCDTEQRVIFSEETSSRIEQAKQQAEDAAASAASAVRQSQSIWSQLAMQKNSGLVSDNEAKLASSAVAIAAAASVAKAAAAAARVAADAALQAKLMADEALIASKSRVGTPEASLHDGVKNLGKVSPSSILKGRDGTSTSDSVFVAARETARKRVEAASAAAKRAENLDAVVKAAEMAAEAVSQAGIIVAMGEPIPLTLSELVEAGPENYWRAQQTSSEQLVKSNPTNREQINVDGTREGLGSFSLNIKEAKQMSDQGKRLSNEMPRTSVDNQMWIMNGVHFDSVTSTERGLNVQNSCDASDLTKTIGVVPESQVGSTNPSVPFPNVEHEGHKLVRILEENSIKEGSIVEVLSSEKGGINVWYSAKVLSLNDGKAHVCFMERKQDEGPGQPTDWVSLEGGDKAPRIRICHPMSLTKYEGAKKRRRAVRGDYTWSVGDKVDAWIQNSWWEGVVTEKSKEDETNLTVQFSAQGDSSVVKAWHLRPSLLWENGQWMECSRSKENNFYSNEGDMSQQKPMKRGRHASESEPTTEARGKDSMSKHTGTEESGKPESSRPLALSAKEKIFTVGKSSKVDNNSDTLRTKRIGLQKEGSKVFGVPKPGKKRKFMDVSKHYVADGAGKTNAGNDSVKFANYLIPQESASRGWKNPSKVVSKGKRVVESKPKTFKPGKPQNVLSRNMSDKDNSSNSAASGLHHGTAQDRLTNVKGSVNSDETSEMQNVQEVGYFPNNKTTEITGYSTVDVSSDAPSLKKKSSSAVPTDMGSRAKTAPPSEKMAKNGEKDVGHNDTLGKSVPNAIEPRRSSRRIQPTSRLLEGLQSSLIISKIPAISHEKGTKTQQRAAPSRGSNHA